MADTGPAREADVLRAVERAWWKTFSTPTEHERLIEAADDAREVEEDRE